MGGTGRVNQLLQYLLLISVEECYIGLVTLLLLLKLQESCLVPLLYVVSFIQTISIIQTISNIQTPELSAVTRRVRIIKGPLYNALYG